MSNDASAPSMSSMGFAPAEAKGVSAEEIASTWADYVESTIKASGVSDELSNVPEWNQPTEFDENVPSKSIKNELIDNGAGTLTDKTGVVIRGGKGKGPAVPVGATLSQPLPKKKPGRPRKVAVKSEPKVDAERAPIPEMAPKFDAWAEPEPSTPRAAKVSKAKAGAASKSTGSGADKGKLLVKIGAYKRLCAKAMSMGKDIDMKAAMMIEPSPSASIDTLEACVVQLRSILHAGDGAKVVKASWEAGLTAVELYGPELLDPFDVDIRGIAQVVKNEKFAIDIDLLLDEIAIERLSGVTMGPSMGLLMTLMSAAQVTSALNKQHPGWRTGEQADDSGMNQVD